MPVQFILRNLKLFFILLAASAFSFYAFGEQKVLDLGEIEITGEVRRPNINLIYSKKYINKAIMLVATEELKKLESELLKPAGEQKTKPKKRKKTPAQGRRGGGGQH